MWGRTLVVVPLLIVAGCVQSDSLICADGRECPNNTVCDDVHALCVTHDQATACAPHVDGDVCTAGSNFTGICDRSYCVPGCGDGVVSGDEQCDDGNFRSHDGCSSACLTESAGWEQWQSPWTGQYGGGAAFDTAAARLVLFGGIGGGGFTGDTWLRDGTTNAWTLGAAGPSPRVFMAMAYDSTRNVTVLFGGRDTTGALIGDTWEYGNGVWTQRSPATSPPARTQAAMAFDASSGHMILFGGFTAPDGNPSNDTWEYDGTTWTQLSETAPPSPRFSASMGYDSTRGRIVLFGGAGSSFFNDTFELVAGQWTPMTPASSPVPRFGAALAFSAARGELVLFGGSTSSSYASDTWEYDATGWKRVVITNAPPGRDFHVLAEDPVANTLVLTGGIGWSADGTNEVFSDVWEYSNNAASCFLVGAPCWVPRPPPFSPNQRATPMAYDGHGLATLFSGDGSLDIYGDAAADTWTFDGTSWRVHTASGPPARRNHALTHDSTSDRVVMFGGKCGAIGPGVDCADTWAWNGSAWTAIMGVGPAARHDATMADDQADGIAVLFGGTSDAAGVLADTWELGPSGWLQNMATPHPPQQPAQSVFEASGRRVILYTATGETWTYVGHAWTQLQPAHTPGARASPMIAYDRARGHVVLFGGGVSGAFDSGLWELGKDAAGNDDWMPVTISGDPPPVRIGGGLAYVDPLHTLVLFGGTGGPSFVSDTWLFRYRSSTPDEVCNNGIDDDGDKQVDSADPDCE